MKKRLLKTVALLLSAICIALCLASCGKEDEKPQESQNAGASDSVGANPVDTSALPSGSFEGENESDTGSSTGAVELQSDTNGTSASLTELVSAYNSGIKAASLVCTSAEQKVSAGALWIGNKTDEKLNLLAADQTALLAKFQNPRPDGVPLTALSAAAVDSAVQRGNVVTYTLKSANTSGEIQNGHGGYINIVDTSGTQTLVEAVKSYANVSGNVKISASSYRLSKGTLTVTYSDENLSGITAVSFSAAQNVNASMKYLVLTINADIDYILTSEYKSR